MGQKELIERLPEQSQSSALPGQWWTEELHVGSRAVFIGILGLAAVLRFALLSQHSVWMDEAFTLWVIQFRWQEIPHLLRLADNHPPLYYLLMKAWISIAGTSDVAIRIPSACLGYLTVPFTYVLMRRVSTESVSLLSALLVSVSPYQIMASQEARMYGLLGVLALASTLALIESVERAGTLRWGAYVILSTSMAYTHYLGLLVLVAHGAWVACCARRQLPSWLAGMAAAAMMYAPWMPILFAHAARESHWIGYHGPVNVSGAVSRLGGIAGLFAFGGSLLGMPSFFFVDTPLGVIEEFLILLPFLVLLWQGVASFSTDRRGLALVGLPIVVPIGVIFFLSLGTPRFQNWWFSALVPFYAMLLSRGLSEVARKLTGRRERILAFLVAGVLVYGIPVLIRYYFDPTFYPFQWRQAAALMETRVKPGDLLLFVDGENGFVNADNKLSLTRYFRTATPSLTYVSLDQPPDPETLRQLPPHYLLDRLQGLDTETARGLALRYPTVWLIAAPPLSDPTPILSALGRWYRLTAESRLNGTRAFPWVYRFDAKTPQIRLTPP